MLIAAGSSEVALGFIELGALILILALLARLAGRFGITAIPLYLLAGLAVGEGGIVQIEGSIEFFHLGAEIGVLAYGATARPARGAVLQARKEGRKVTFIRPITLWPFPGPRIAEACEGLRTLVVPEMNLGQVNRELERFVSCEVVPFGKIGGEIHSSAQIREVMEGVGS